MPPPKSRRKTRTELTDAPSDAGLAKAREPSWRRRTALAGIAALVLVGLPALTGFLGRFGWLFELAGHFRVQFFWGLLLAMGLLAAARRVRLALVAAILLVLHAALLGPFYRPGSPVSPVGAGGKELRIVSLNVFHKNHDGERVLAFIRESSPDIAFFVEVDGYWDETLSALKDEWPHAFSLGREDPHGIALFSRRPFVHRLEFLSEDRPAIVATFEVEGRPLAVIGAHTQAPKFANRTMSGSEIATRRAREMRILSDLVTAETGPRILVGDLNTTSWSPLFADLVEKTGLVDTRLGRGVQPSWPATRPAFVRVPIDHCLVSPDIEVLDRRLGRDVGSDHLPVIVDLRLP